MASVWRTFDAARSRYVPRCGKCGRYESSMKNGNSLYTHWFFNGVYCRSCVQDVLYDNARILEEIK